SLRGGPDTHPGNAGRNEQLFRRQHARGLRNPPPPGQPVHVGPSRSLNGQSARAHHVTSDDVMPTHGCSTVLRHFGGPEADELAFHCRPEGPPTPAQVQADAAYRSLSNALGPHGASFRDLTSETLFLRDIRRDLPAVLEVRGEVLAHLGESAGALPPTVIQQAPPDDAAASELTGTAQ